METDNEGDQSDKEKRKGGRAAASGIKAASGGRRGTSKQTALAPPGDGSVHPTRVEG